MYFNMIPKIKWYEWPLLMFFAVWAIIECIAESAWESLKGGKK